MATSPGKKGKNSDEKVIAIKPIVLKYYKYALIGLALGVVIFLSITFIYSITVSKKAEEQRIILSAQEAEKELDEHIIKSLSFQSLDAQYYFNLIKLTLKQNFQDKNEEISFLKSSYKTDNYGIYLKLETVLESAKEFKKTKK